MNNNSEFYIGMPIDLDDCDCSCGCSDTVCNGSDGNWQQPPCMIGRDFENWPLAMAYVPMQPWEKTYGPEEALQAGTVFPGLDLPFLGGMKR